MNQILNHSLEEGICKILSTNAELEDELDFIFLPDHVDNVNNKTEILPFLNSFIPRYNESKATSKSFCILDDTSPTLNV